MLSIKKILGFLTYTNSLSGFFSGCLGILGGKNRDTINLDLKLCWDNFCVFLLNTWGISCTKSEKKKKRQTNEKLVNGLHSYQKELVTILQEQSIFGICRIYLATVS